VVKISTKRLRSLAVGVDEQHREAMVDFRDRMGEIHRPGSRSRRRFLAEVGVGSATIALGSTLVPAFRLLPAGAQEEETSDEDLAVFAASVELAAVAAYQAALDTDLLSAPVASVAQLFQTHHEEHAQAFESLGGSTPEANQGVLDVFGPQIEEASDEAGVLTVALAIEEGAAATYEFALGVLGPEAAAATSTILPVEGQHAVVLGAALELQPADYLPGLQTQSGALDPAAFPPS
jgi:hypothetical protein